MARKTNTTASGTIVLLLSLLFSQQGMSNEATPDCNESNQRVAAPKPLLWPHIKQKATLTSSCWVNAMQVEAWRQEQDLVQVDVRGKAQKQAYPLEGALDIELSSLQDKTFLRDNRVVLIGDGFDQPELDQACRQLRKAGFKDVYALQDGIRARLPENHSATQITGKFSDITPAEFLAGSRATPWIVITWDLPFEDTQKLPEKPAEQWFSAEGNLSAMAEHLTKLAQMKRNPIEPVKIVVVTVNGEANQQLRSLLQQHGATANLLWLQGGMQAYQHYIQQQHNIRINAGLSLKRPCFGTALRK